MPAPLRALERASAELNARYTLEIVEPHVFCPFAKSARVSGRSRVVVDVAAQLAPGGVWWESAAALATDVHVEVVQFVFPLVDVSADQWTDECKQITRLFHAERAGASVYAVAAFHPRTGGAKPSRTVDLLRRTPDPTMQWLRLDALERVKDGRDDRDRFLPPDPEALFQLLNASKRPSLSKQIEAQNDATVGRLGREVVYSMVRDLIDTRDHTYSRIGVTDRRIPMWAEAAEISEGESGESSEGV